MYICMYVCMYMYMYVHTYIYIYICIRERERECQAGMNMCSPDTCLFQLGSADNALSNAQTDGQVNGERPHVDPHGTGVERLWS